MQTDTINTRITEKWSPVVSVVLQRDNHTGLFDMIVYNANESLAGSYNLNAISMRAAQLEATAWVKDLGWDPVGRWNESVTGADPNEGIRMFKQAK